MRGRIAQQVPAPPGNDPVAAQLQQEARVPEPWPARHKAPIDAALKMRIEVHDVQLPSIIEGEVTSLMPEELPAALAGKDEAVNLLCHAGRYDNQPPPQQRMIEAYLLGREQLVPSTQAQLLREIEWTSAGIALRGKAVEGEIIPRRTRDRMRGLEGEGEFQGACAAEASPDVGAQDQAEAEVQQVLSPFAPARLYIAQPVDETAQGIEAKTDDADAREVDPPAEVRLLAARSAQPAPQDLGLELAEELAVTWDQQ